MNPDNWHGKKYRVFSRHLNKNQTIFTIFPHQPIHVYYTCEMASVVFYKYEWNVYYVVSAYLKTRRVLFMSLETR